VHFEFTHEFDISLDALELAVISPHLADKLTARLASTFVISMKEHVLRDDVLTRVMFFQANVKLPAFAQGVVTSDMCAWHERTTFRLKSHSAEWVVEPNVKAEWKRYFQASGTYALTALDGGRTRRTLKGALKLNVPVVRNVAERMIVGEMKKTFEAEAATLHDLATLV
jgi:hypothetical protein